MAGALTVPSAVLARYSDRRFGFATEEVIDFHEVVSAGRKRWYSASPVVERSAGQNPGDLIHVDIKKIAGIPDGGGWRVRGRGYAGESAKTRRAGYRYIHSALDDRSRIVYSEILDDEQGITAADFWRRAAAWCSAASIPAAAQRRRMSPSLHRFTFRDVSRAMEIIDSMQLVVVGGVYLFV